MAEWFAFIGKRAASNVPGSPYAINFLPSATKSSGMRPMNVSTYSCGDTSLGCSCGDCPSSTVCSNLTPPQQHKEGSCSVRIGSIKVRDDLFSFIFYNPTKATLSSHFRREKCIHLYIDVNFIYLSMQAKCVDISLAILYIILVSLFFGWGLFHRTGEKNASQRKQWFTNDGNQVYCRETQKNEDLPVEVFISAT